MAELKCAVQYRKFFIFAYDRFGENLYYNVMVHAESAECARKKFLSLVGNDTRIESVDVKYGDTNERKQ